MFAEANSARNVRWLDTELAKLDHWADDTKRSIELELDDLDRQIAAARRAALLAASLSDKLQAQKNVKSLEAARAQKRRDLFEAQDRVEAQRAEIIRTIESRMAQSHESEPLFQIRWSVS